MRALHGHAVAAAAAVVTTLAGATAAAAEVQVDRSIKHQFIDGFGFFGAHDVWWGSADSVINDDWVRLVIEDLGLSIWRNEYYPPADDISGQDADWNKQRPVAEAFRDQAAESGSRLKTILTVWSPPAAMKCLYEDDVLYEDTPHPEGTKGGGVLCPSRRTEFANWLVEGLDLYADVGLPVYALSFQNEPYFWQSYNSCFYAQDMYAETLAHVGPIIRSAYPDVKLFGAENMLEIECGRDSDQFDPWWYTANIMSRPEALAELDIWALHGYSDGVTATASSRMSTLWANFLGGVAETNRPIWMTETSGYVDSWEKGPNSSGDETQGAMDLAQAIYAGLRYGNLSAWVWWQGSELGSNAPSEYALMRGTEYRAKRYYVSKNYYRYVRPGAQRVEATSDDPELLVLAFEHSELGSFTMVLINAGQDELPLNIAGADVPTQLELHRSSASEDCAELGTVSPDSIVLPARSVTTLTAGSYHDEVSSSGGSGGAAGGGGTTGSGGSSAAAGTSSLGGTTGAGSGGAHSAAGSGGATSGDAGSASVAGAPAAGGSAAAAGQQPALFTAGASSTTGGNAAAQPAGAPATSTADPGVATGGFSASGEGGAENLSSTADDAAQEGGCGCRFAVASGQSCGLWALLALLSVSFARRRHHGGGSRESRAAR